MAEDGSQGLGLGFLRAEGFSWVYGLRHKA